MVLISVLKGLEEIMMGNRFAGIYSIVAASKKANEMLRLLGRRLKSDEPHTPQVFSSASRKYRQRLQQIRSADGA